MMLLSDLCDMEKVISVIGKPSCSITGINRGTPTSIIGIDMHFQHDREPKRMRKIDGGSKRSVGRCVEPGSNVGRVNIRLVVGNDKSNGGRPGRAEVTE